MVDALTWLLAVELLGILALPFCFVLFRRLPDRGITLAKPLALVLFSYLLWVAGLTHVAPNTQITIIVILILAAGVGGLVLRATAERVKTFLKEEWRTLLVAEAVFLVFFLLWLGITSESPAISGTEKPMDFGFMNAVLQSRYFPPEDPWLAGHSISYYYFGHFIMAFLVKLTAVPAGVGYNLAISLLPALVAIGSFGLLYNLVRLSGGSIKAGLVFGLAAPALVMLIGNLEGFLEFVHAQGWGGSGFWAWVGIDGLEGSAVGTVDYVWSWVGADGPGGGAASSGAFPDNSNWWWHATRVINTFAGGQGLDYTITEFPMFSFLLGDLHAHVMSLPFLILGLSIALNLFRSEDTLGAGWLRRHPVEAVAIALFIGSLAFINLWDLPLIAAVLGVVLLIKSYADTGGDLQWAAIRTAAMLLPILGLSVVLFLPFYWDLGGQTVVILPLQDVSTRPFLFLITMGFFTVLAISFVLRQLPGLRRPTRDDAPLAGLILVVAFAPLIIWSAIVLLLKVPTDGLSAALGDVVGRGLWVLPGLTIVSVASYSAAQRLHLGREPVAAFTLLMVAVAFYLLVGAELFYVNDLFGGAFRRMNTVFKVYYQSWLLLALAGAYGLYYWSSHRPSLQSSTGRNPGRIRVTMRLGHHAWMGGIIVLLAASLYYSVGAVLDRTGVLARSHAFEDNTLNGLAFIRDQDPGEYHAIRWLRDDASWGRIVEAVGGSYSAYGRISSSTGLPTVLGWKGHELTWRGSNKPFDGREDDVVRIYQSGDGEEVRRLLESYNVRYIYLGQRERAAYGFPTPVQPRDNSDLERIRAVYVNDLRYRGWTGTFLAGDSVDAIYSNYLATVKGLSNLATFGFLRTAFEDNGVIIYELVSRADRGTTVDNEQNSD